MTKDEKIENKEQFVFTNDHISKTEKFEIEIHTLKYVDNISDFYPSSYYINLSPGIYITSDNHVFIKGPDHLISWLGTLESNYMVAPLIKNPLTKRPMGKAEEVTPGLLNLLSSDPHISSDTLLKAIAITNKPELGEKLFD